MTKSIYPTGIQTSIGLHRQSLILWMLIRPYLPSPTVYYLIHFRRLFDTRSCVDICYTGGFSIVPVLCNNFVWSNSWPTPCIRVGNHTNPFGQPENRRLWSFIGHIYTDLFSTWTNWYSSPAIGIVNEPSVSCPLMERPGICFGNEHNNMTYMMRVIVQQKYYHVPHGVLAKLVNIDFMEWSGCLLGDGHL